MSVRESENLRAFVEQFRRNANSLAVRYGASVWLVGGALRDEAPRDWDIRVVVTEDEAWRLFGRKPRSDRPVESLYEFEPWEWRRGYENLKQSRIMFERFRRNIDFQVQIDFEVRSSFTHQPKLRLDTTPDHVLRAGNPMADAFFSSSSTPSQPE